MCPGVANPCTESPDHLLARKALRLHPADVPYQTDCHRHRAGLADHEIAPVFPHERTAGVLIVGIDGSLVRRHCSKAVVRRAALR
jgi:hypothetical protein